MADDAFQGFRTAHAGTITTITSDNNHKRTAARSNRHSLLPFRHVSSSSSEDGSHHSAASATSGGAATYNHRQSRRFHHGLKLLDRTGKTRGGEATKGDHVRSQPSGGSGSGTDAAQSPSGSTASFPAMTKEEFEALPPTIQRKVSLGTSETAVRFALFDFPFPFMFCARDRRGKSVMVKG